MTMKTKERVASVLLFCVFAYFFVNGRSFPKIPAMFPIGITVAGMALCVGLFVKTFVYKNYPKEPKLSAEQRAEQKAAYIHIGGSIAMLLVYVALMRIVGFYTVSFVFMIIFSWFNDNEKHKLWTYPVVAACVLAVIYGIFSLFLQVRLPAGLLF